MNVPGVSHPVVQEATCFFNLSSLGSPAGQSAFVMQAAWHQRGHVDSGLGQGQLPSTGMYDPGQTHFKFLLHI